MSKSLPKFCQSMGRLEEKADVGAEQKLKFVNAQKKEAERKAGQASKVRGNRGELSDGIATTDRSWQKKDGVQTRQVGAPSQRR